MIFDSAMTGTVRKFTYAELQTEVQAVAAVLRNLGVAKGDRVVIYMPMIRKRCFPCWPARDWAPSISRLRWFCATNWQPDWMTARPRCDQR